MLFAALFLYQRFVIANCIALGIRLTTAREHFGANKADFACQGIYTLEDFYHSIGLGYTPDYIRKLIQVGRLGNLFPNLALISCCGIGDIIKFLPEFMEYMKTAPQDAKFWRTTPNGAFGWQRHTRVEGFEGLKKRRLFDYAEEAPEESFNDWEMRKAEEIGDMLAENAAAAKADQEEQEAEEAMMREAMDED
jgi:hypothetical protein